MAKRFTPPAFFTATLIIMALALASSAAAQDINLGAGGADQTWKGTQPNAAAGIWLDLGAVSNDTRRDLIVGAPGTASIAGAVYVIFGGPDRTGEFVLSSAETVITSAELGNLFGYATAAGNILNTEGTTPRNLAVGAPGAQGGRGVVYLFAGGFTTPSVRTTANAVFTVTGAPGDALGTVLATADLDNDGFREIIIGAPGTNRVYVIKGGPALTGNLNLATTAAAATINAPGIGRVLTAGDVTNDNIADLIIGAPSANTVYVMNGLNGTMPTAAGGAFFGVDAGDEAGAGLRIGDFDGDGKRDLVFSAPGGDGPANDRANAGETYLFWGPVATTGGRSLAAANVIFFGAAPGYRAGASIAAGDINRDTPNDLVVHSTGAVSGAGQLEIYYGRARTSIGVAQADGRRFVDFATAGQVSRRIIGDPAAGPMTSAQVFEVTGEGARDIIVGIATAEAGAGKLYFTISPKMRITPVTLNLSVNAGGSVTSASPVSLVNKSTVVISWESTSTQPWLTSSPVAGSADQAHPSSLFVVASAQGLTAGTYTGKVNVSSTSPDLEMTLPIDVTLTVTGTAPPPPPPPPGPPPDPTPTPGTNTRVALNRSGLFFGGVEGANVLKTGPQDVGVLFTNGASTWTVSSSAAWLDVSPASGSGSGTFNVSIKTGTYNVGTLTGTLILTAPGVPNSPVTLPITLRVARTTTTPFGFVDTPLDNTTGVVGAIPVTGWALDDIGIKQINIWRDPVAGEITGAGKIFLGRAIHIDGARPDVDAGYSQPFDYKAGWGFMVLTNMLPNEGNGTFVLHMYAEDYDGHTVLLGSRRITCDNANSVLPFGAIDTPDQGGTVSGTTYMNFGWALTRMPNRIPIDGSTILVYIDGVPVGRPVYNNNRSDISSLFPGRANSNGAVGYYEFDTTPLANGVHTIAWGVTDNAGNAVGIGSRYFTVLNGGLSSALTLDPASSVQTASGGGAEVRESATLGLDTGKQTADLAAVPVTDVPVYTRAGFDQTASLDLVEADASGAATLVTEEAGRVALTLGPALSGDGEGYEGYLVAGGKLSPLPAGAFLDKRSGDFYWQPGVGFVGNYEFVFVRTMNGGRERIPVSVNVEPRKTKEVRREK